MDGLTLDLLTRIILISFEGIGISMTSHPGEAKSVFRGYDIGRTFSDSGALLELYGYLWCMFIPS